jgi:hypothetical protein
VVAGKFVVDGSQDSGHVGGFSGEQWMLRGAMARVKRACAQAC